MAARGRTLLIPALLCATLACTGGGLLARRAAARTPTPAHSDALLTSRELWATIDVCSPTDQPNTIGVRGSMPGNHKAQDRMYMSFRLEYRNRANGRWATLSTARAVFVYVGTGASARQGGRSFQLVPVAGQPAFTFRGVVEFQWRRGRHVLSSATRATEAGHRSLAGADPATFSAATCQIG
jgi:hypothetical protein